MKTRFYACTLGVLVFFEICFPHTFDNAIKLLLAREIEKPSAEGIFRKTKKHPFG